MPEQIRQIIPAADWMASFQEPDESLPNSLALVCWALTDLGLKGMVVPLDNPKHPTFADGLPGFKGYYMSVKR
jgi:hypothetical protein